MLNPNREKIIGGTFGLPRYLHQVRSNPDFLDGNPILFFNARSGIKFVIDHIKPQTIWVPSYLCPDILSAINPEIAKIAFYPVNSQLKIDLSSFENLLQPDDLFLFIDYFGFPFDAAVVKEIKRKGCLIFRDCNQSLFHDRRQDDCDFHIYCPRKFLGVPDGGILHFRENININPPKLSSPELEAIYHFVCALVLRREFDLYGGDREWYQHFQIGEAQLKPENSSMSDLTLLLLQMAFDYPEIKKQRRLNYQALSKKLSEFAIFPDLFDEVVPLGFPIRLDNRDHVRQALFTHNIYPPVHWDLTGFTPVDFNESHQLAKNMITLPCDQRYTEEDMNWMADRLLENV